MSYFQKVKSKYGAYVTVVVAYCSFTSHYSITALQYRSLQVGFIGSTEEQFIKKYR